MPKPAARKPRRPRRPAPATDLAALTPQQAARLLKAPPEAIRRHLAAGAPAGPDGRINLIHYAAWLNQRLATDAR